MCKKKFFPGKLPNLPDSEDWQIPGAEASKRRRHQSPIPEGAEIIEICDSDSLESRDNENLPAR